MVANAIVRINSNNKYNAKLVYLGNDKEAKGRDTCSHALWVNSLAVGLAGITKDTPNPTGGEILRDKGGNATGVLTDTAMGMVRDKIPAYSEERKKEAYIKGQQDLLSYGITSVMDAIQMKSFMP